MQLTKEQLVEAIWLAAINKKYLGIRVMKAIATELLQNIPEANKKIRAGYFVNYKKYHYTEWYTWYDGIYNYQLYKTKVGRIEFDVCRENDFTGENELIENLVLDQNLNIRFSNRNKQVFEVYRNIHEKEWINARNKYMGAPAEETNF